MEAKWGAMVDIRKRKFYPAVITNKELECVGDGFKKNYRYDLKYLDGSNHTEKGVYADYIRSLD